MVISCVRAAVLSLFAATALGGCGGSSAGPPPAPDVSIHNFSFSPQSLRVMAGSTVRWTNNDGSVHTATAATGGFDTGNIAPGQSATIAFTTPGTFAYRCNIHQYMTATVTVT